MKMSSLRPVLRDYVDLASDDPDGQEAYEQFAVALMSHAVQDAFAIPGATREAIESDLGITTEGFLLHLLDQVKSKARPRVTGLHSAAAGCFGTKGTVYLGVCLEWEGGGPTQTVSAVAAMLAVAMFSCRAEDGPIPDSGGRLRHLALSEAPSGAARDLLLSMPRVVGPEGYVPVVMQMASAADTVVARTTVAGLLPFPSTLPLSLETTAAAPTIVSLGPAKEGADDTDAAVAKHEIAEAGERKSERGDGGASTTRLGDAGGDTAMPPTESPWVTDPVVAAALEAARRSHAPHTGCIAGVAIECVGGGDDDGDGDSHNKMLFAGSYVEVAPGSSSSLCPLAAALVMREMHGGPDIRRVILAEAFGSVLSHHTSVAQLLALAAPSAVVERHGIEVRSHRSSMAALGGKIPEDAMFGEGFADGDELLTVAQMQMMLRHHEARDEEDQGTKGTMPTDISAEDLAGLRALGQAISKDCLTVAGAEDSAPCTTGMMPPSTRPEAEFGSAGALRSLGADPTAALAALSASLGAGLHFEKI